MRGSRSKPPVLKRFGQHFLHDQAVLGAIAEAASPAEGEVIVEIGPGRGALTDLLAQRPNRLIAIEIDRALSESLREHYAGNPKVTIVEQDVLQVDIATLAGAPFVVVGNVPYYITTPILFHVLKPPYPRHAVFLVQREVAERIVAGPGSKTYGALSANVQAVASAEIIRLVPPGAFRPPPKVDSAVVRVVPRADPIIATDEVAAYRGFVQALFGMRRKQIGNSLRSASQLTAEAAAAVLAGLGMDPAARAESLSPGELATLMRASRQQAQ
ncbi:MAG: 16S rRNA (adenine(1518)-N(6)/adenine(1519)-N(6))-dimethyltransferase RsmA [Gemmatimonadaceae bacterium]